MSNIVRSIVIVTGQACTLKCKDCGNFSPYSSKKRYDISSIKDDLKRFVRCVDKLKAVQIQGGEPFLYSELVDLINFLRFECLIEKITVATNGTIVPSDAVMDCMQKNDVRVRVSNYKEVVDQDRFDALIGKLKKWGICHRVYSFVGRDGAWCELGGLERERDADSDLVAERFATCPFRGCLTLENGLLGRCARATISHEVQGFKPGVNDYVRVREIPDAGNLGKAVRQYLDQPSFMAACRYCNGGNGKVIPPALQIGQ